MNFRPLTIRAVLNGWMVEAGCQTLVFTEREKLVKAFEDYLADPDETEKCWRETAINRQLLAQEDQTFGGTLTANGGLYIDPCYNSSLAAGLGVTTGAWLPNQAEQ